MTRPFAWLAVALALAAFAGGRPTVRGATAAAVQQREKVAAEGIAARMQGVELTFHRRAGEEDTLYGSVTVSEVASVLAERGFEVDRRRIQIAHHIKRLGTHHAEVHLHREVVVPIVIHVERAGEESEA